ncbi:hypothetical protein BS78_10G167400 [Paspalum vaginatum]|nr:hypothetical protein BS78_10G167400 [Paspalum vaginatum]
MGGGGGGEVRPHRVSLPPTKDASSGDMASARSVSTGGDFVRPAICRSPSPSPPPPQRSPPEMVVIPRSEHLDTEENHLSLALVATVGGTRPIVSVVQVEQYLVSLLSFDADQFSVHLYSPEDFLVVFRSARSAADRDRVLHGPPPPSPPFRLIWKRWLRTSLATPEVMRFRVLLVLRGIPAHAWSVDTAK